LQVSDIPLQISKRKDYGRSEVQFAPKFPQNGRLLAQKQPKICQSCAKVALHGKNCTVAQKRKSCAPQHRNFLVGLTVFYTVGFYLTSIFVQAYSRLGCPKIKHVGNVVAVAVLFIYMPNAFPIVQPIVTKHSRTVFLTGDSMLHHSAMMDQERFHGCVDRLKGNIPTVMTVFLT